MGAEFLASSITDSHLKLVISHLFLFLRTDACDKEHNALTSKQVYQHCKQHGGYNEDLTNISL